jgi:membrane protein DedA with SNARE-associated domain
MNIDINSLISQYGYFGFFLFGLLNFVVPSEPVLTFAGFQIQQGNLNYFLVLFSALAGSFVKTSIIFGMGYILGKQFLIKYSRWTGFKDEHLTYVKERITQYGYRILTPLQFVPVVRRFLGGPAGILKLNFWRFMYYNLIGVALWFSFLISLGYIYGKGYNKVSPAFKVYLDYLTWGIGLFFAILVVYEVLKHFNVIKNRH